MGEILVFASQSIVYIFFIFIVGPIVNKYYESKGQQTANVKWSRGKMMEF
jgi:hypothetical protein